MAGPGQSAHSRHLARSGGLRVPDVLRGERPVAARLVRQYLHHRLRNDFPSGRQCAGGDHRSLRLLDHRDFVASDRRSGCRFCHRDDREHAGGHHNPRPMLAWAVAIARRARDFVRHIYSSTSCVIFPILGQRPGASTAADRLDSPALNHARTASKPNQINPSRNLRMRSIFLGVIHPNRDTSKGYRRRNEKLCLVPPLAPRLMRRPQAHASTPGLAQASFNSVDQNTYSSWFWFFKDFRDRPSSFAARAARPHARRRDASEPAQRAMSRRGRPIVAPRPGFGLKRELDLPPTSTFAAHGHHAQRARRRPNRKRRQP